MLVTARCAAVTRCVPAVVWGDAGREPRAGAGLRCPHCPRFLVQFHATAAQFALWWASPSHVFITGKLALGLEVQLRTPL